MGVLNGATALENIMEVPEKIKYKNKNPYDPVIPPLGYLLKRTQDSLPSLKEVSAVMFIAAFLIGQELETTQCPSTDECIEKMWSTHIQWNISQPLKRRKRCHML